MDSSDSVPLSGLFFLSDLTLRILGIDAINLLIYGLTFIFLIFLSGVMSSIEISFFSLSNSEQKELEKLEDRWASFALDILKSPKELLSTILFANLAIYLLLLGVGFKLYELLLGNVLGNEPYIMPLVTLSIIIVLRLVFGEIAPKVYATQHNLEVTRRSILLLRFLLLIFKPFVCVYLIVASFIESKLEKYNRLVLSEELDQALEHFSSPSSDQSIKEENLLKGIVNLANISVTQIMKARVDIIYVDTSLNFHEVLDTVRNSGYSRVPVINGDLDKTVGMIYAKDLLPYLKEDSDLDWHPLIKRAIFVPESKMIDDLLKEFKAKRVHLAMVVDEYGGVSGLVTLEDVMEEVIGEIKDEFDDIHEIDFRKIDDNNYVFEGKTGLVDACKIMNIPTEEFDDEKGEADSIAGLLLEVQGELPELHEEIAINDFIFTVLEVNTTRIVRVKITKQNA